MWRFDIGQAVLQFDGLLQLTDRVVVMLPARGNLTGQHSFSNLEEYPRGFFFLAPISPDLLGEIGQRIVLSLGPGQSTSRDQCQPASKPPHTVHEPKVF